MVVLKVPFEFPHQPARYGTQFPVRFQRLRTVLRMIAETLVPIDSLKDERITLPQREVKLPDYGQDLADNLLMQLRIGGVSHVLFLNRGIYEGDIMMFPIIIIPVHADTFRQNKFQAAFPDALTEMNQFTGIAGKGWDKFHHSAKVLVVSVLTPLFHNGFV